MAVVVENRCVDNSRVALGLADGANAFVHGNHFERAGGMPPLVAIRGQSNALMTDNEIRGGGVAGILVQGRAKLDGNRFFGRGPGQGAAIWISEGSHVDVADNRIRGLLECRQRHGIARQRHRQHRPGLSEDGYHCA